VARRASVAVVEGGVDEVDPEGDRPFERRDTYRVVNSAPVPTADTPGANADLRYLPVRPSESSRRHPRNLDCPRS
jgi:hypothetical protein